MSLTIEVARDHARNLLDDTCEVINASDDPVVLVAVEVVGVHTFDPDTGDFLPLPLQPSDDGQSSGVTLRFVDNDIQTEVDQRESWFGVVVPAGSVLRATVLNNRELRLTYTTRGSQVEETVTVQGNI
jgi:hypothetical protein